MKVILSHDVDHITVWEHLLKDLVLPKYFVRSNLEWIKGMITTTEYVHRVADFYYNKWNRVDEIIAFHSSLGIKSTFFVGVNNGVGLSYALHQSAAIIQRIVHNNFEAGVHGINYETALGVKMEYNIFQELSGQKEFGIRMHYLRKTENTLRYVDQAGYCYDATESGYSNPYLQGGLLEFPLQLMDGWAIEGERRYQSRNLHEAKEYTMKMIDKALDSRLNFMSILFHDRYFSKSFYTWMQWYIWLIEYLKNQNFEFIDHITASKEILKNAKDIDGSRS